MRIFRTLVLNEPAAPAGEPPDVLSETVLDQMRRATAGAGRVRESVAFAEATATARRLAAVDPKSLGPRSARLAFWINVYNALALHGAVALGLRRSVWEVWNFFGRVCYRIGGFVFSLDAIEHGILRGNRRRVWPPWPVFRPGDPRVALAIDPIDPRIHFALNCGARSCPPVRAYRAAEIDRQLDLATRGFVNAELSLDDHGRIVCSRLFKWYGDDFGSPVELTAFLQAHLDDGPVRRALAAGVVPCRRFHRYSWTLPPAPSG